MARYPSGVLFYTGGTAVWQFKPTTTPSSVTTLQPIRFRSNPQVALVTSIVTTTVPRTLPVKVSSTVNVAHGTPAGAGLTRFPLPSPASGGAFAIDINSSAQAFFTDSGAAKTYVR
jgi:hypothetical protein